MKRTIEELTAEGATKKKVRFDPKTSDPRIEGEPSIQKLVRRARAADNDDLDVLGRRPQLTAAEQQAQDLKDKKHTLDSDEEDVDVEPRKLDIKSVMFSASLTFFLVALQVASFTQILAL
jgi:hypothetical protein